MHSLQYIADKLLVDNILIDYDPIICYCLVGYDKLISC